MSFLIKDEKLLEKYNEIWKKVSNVIKKEFESKPLYNEKYLKTKIRSYNGKINTNCHNNKIPKEGFQCTCPSVLLIRTVYRKDKDCYSQVVLEEFKYVVTEIKMSKFINDDKEISSDDSDRKNSDEKDSNE